MSATYKIGRGTALAGAVVLFGLGVAAERCRQSWIANVGDLSIRRTDSQIALTIDGDPFTAWQGPVTLRAGTHQFRATWRGLHLDTRIEVKRDDRAPGNRVTYSLFNGQLQVERNSHLVDVVPRPAPEVCTIQTAAGKFWHTADGRISLRQHGEHNAAEPYTVHWLRPDHREAFIQSKGGQFVTHVFDSLHQSSPFLRLAEDSDRPTVFKIERLEADNPWTRFVAGRYFVDADADPTQVRTTSYEVFASPLLLRAVEASEATNPEPPLSATPAVQLTRSAASVRLLKGHTNVIRAVVFTPDGRHMISGSSDGTIRFWNVRQGTQVDEIRTHRPALSLAVSGDGKSLACGMADAVVKIWTLDHGPELAHHSERILSREYRGDVLSIAFSPDDTKVAAGGNRRQHTRIWNLLAPDERCKSSTINGAVTSLVWSRSGEQILLCEEDSLRWWPEIADRVESPHVHSMGKLLIRSGDKPLVVVGDHLLDAETFEVIHTFPQRPGMRTVSAQLLEGENLLVTGDVVVNTKYEPEPDELVSLWDLKTGQAVAVLRDHAGQVGNIAVSPSGAYVAYGSGLHDTNRIHEKKPTGDYDIRVWRIR